jgi:hypothetical protein
MDLKGKKEVSTIIIVGKSDIRAEIEIQYPINVKMNQIPDPINDYDYSKDTASWTQFQRPLRQKLNQIISIVVDYFKRGGLDIREVKYSHLTGSFSANGSSKFELQMCDGRSFSLKKNHKNHLFV